MNIQNEFPDFAVVDLFTRHHISESVEHCAKDVYLFRPVLLTYRTWIYHEFFRTGQVCKGSDEHEMIKRLLAERCIDAPINAGRWSPLMSYIPMAIGISLAQNFIISSAAIFTLVLLYMITVFSNSFEVYRVCRLCCLPVRIAFFV